MTKNNKLRLTYKQFYNTCPNITFKEYKSIMECFFDNLYEELLKGFPHLLPKKLGVIQIKKAETKGNKLDFAKTKEYGIKVFHKNKHSEGYYAFTDWDKSHPRGVFRNKGIYDFEPTRARKQQISKAVTEDNIINYLFEGK